MKTNANHNINFKGSITPMTLLKLSNLFRAMKSGETIELTGLDEEIKKDLFKVLHQFSYKVMADEKTEEEKSVYRVRLKKE